MRDIHVTWRIRWELCVRPPRQTQCETWLMYNKTHRCVIGLMSDIYVTWLIRWWAVRGAPRLKGIVQHSSCITRLIDMWHESCVTYTCHNSSGGELCVEAPAANAVYVVTTHNSLARVDGRFIHWVCCITLCLRMCISYVYRMCSIHGDNSQWSCTRGWAIFSVSILFNCVCSYQLCMYHEYVLSIYLPTHNWLARICIKNIFYKHMPQTFLARIYGWFNHWVDSILFFSFFLHIYISFM